MEEIKINGKALYAPKGAAREYGRVGCNFYTGCPHECEYCYLKRGAPSKWLGGNTVQLKKCFKDEDHALDVLSREMKKNIDVLKKTGVFFSFTTDPMIPETRDLTLLATELLAWHQIPVRILTKDATFVEYDKFVKDLNWYPFRNYVSIGFTLTGRDDMEPKASTNYDRIQAMRLLHGQCIRTWASLEPVIDWFHTEQMVEMSLEYCDHYKIGLRSGVKKDYYRTIQSCLYLSQLVRKISFPNRTVYLKESARQMLRRCYSETYCNKEILSYTVDMDGNKFNVKE